MKSIQNEIKKIELECLDQIKKAPSTDALEEVRVAFLGRNGIITELMGRLKTLSLDEKRIVGPQLNALKQSLSEAHQAHLQELEKSSSKKIAFDVTAYKPNQPKGSLHICTQVLEQLTSIFMTMGYQIVDGPELETDYYNFGALNIPQDHPARDSHDTFWLTLPGTLLRTHTSSVQTHIMEKGSPPFSIFAPGRVYRNEALDASHEFMFSQAEALFIDKNVSMANLLATAKTFLQHFFGKSDLEIRVRPGYFPFVEPGIEIDGSCPFCKEGCSICKHTRWIELLGAGLVHPNVLKASGIDPQEYSGFAFGFGIERLIMIKYGISDIRLFHSAQLSFLDQFA